MKRKEFIKKGFLGIGAIAALSVGNQSCDKENINECTSTPSEIGGPFPIKTPSDLIKENIIGDRNGIPLLIKILVENVNNDCRPLEGVYVDIWQCDGKGNYSEYSGQLEGDFTGSSFLRGRQLTDVNGLSSFVSIYPGWYPGRAPHIHLEVLEKNGTSILTTQIAFPEAISKAVYTTANYGVEMDTLNNNDGSFKNSLALNMAEVEGDITDGYTLTKVIKVKA